jgi:hypothetical protein
VTFVEAMVASRDARDDPRAAATAIVPNDLRMEKG